MYYWTPKRIKELKAKGYKLREAKHDPGNKPASVQAPKLSNQPTQEDKPQAKGSSCKPESTSSSIPAPGYKR